MWTIAACLYGIVGIGFLKAEYRRCSGEGSALFFGILWPIFVVGFLIDILSAPVTWLVRKFL